MIFTIITSFNSKDKQVSLNLLIIWIQESTMKYTSRITKNGFGNDRLPRLP